MKSYEMNAGGDAACAEAARGTPHEEGGGHGTGLGQRDHDAHALPPEGEHHQHLQTGRHCQSAAGQSAAGQTAAGQSDVGQSRVSVLLASMHNLYNLDSQSGEHMLMPMKKVKQWKRSKQIMDILKSQQQKTY